METQEPPHEIDPPSTVLLLGSGFSLESRNLHNVAPPNGPSLRKHFINALNFPADTDINLQILAEEFSHDSPTLLYNELYNMFHISKISDNQEQILKETWLRIYTTNYDDTVEFYRHDAKLESHSFTSFDDLPARIPLNATVHLHGAVSRLSEENTLDEIVLGENSYVRQYLIKSPWYTQFQADIRFSSALFIIGYSLSDYHIASLLLENPSLAARTYFIQPPPSDPIFRRRTAKYGHCLFIGIDGFSNLLKALPRTKPTSDLSRLKAFRALDPLRDRKGLRPPTALEILNLFVFGTFNYSRCAATLPEESYVISRSNEVGQAIAAVEANRSVIIDSRLGNGKTVFLHLIFLALAREDIRALCFEHRHQRFHQKMKHLRLLQSWRFFLMNTLWLKT
jgi:hypothetical protein